MKITFFGQLGLPRLLETDKTSRELRTDVLARALVANKHTVTVLGTQPYITHHGNYHGIKLKRIHSLNPQKPGGFFYLLGSLIHLSHTQPDAIHVQGWRAALFLRALAWLCPDSTIVWTIDTWPATSGWTLRFIAREAQQFSDAITVPTRWLQYLLLQELGLRTEYIPDGYTPSTLPDSKVSSFALRKGQYNVALVDSAAPLREIAQAYVASGSRKKLVVMLEATTSLRRLARTYPWLTFIGPQHGRTQKSIIAQSNVVIMAEQTPSLTTILQTMAAQKALIATTHPLYQETLGVTAQFYKPGDQKGLQAALRSIIKSPKIQGTWGAAAKARAFRHFRWARIVPEYGTLYHAVRHQVSIDSVRAVTFTRAAV